MGKLIVLEGLDGSGKSTQLARLEHTLHDLAVAVRVISFPRYESPASMPVQMYLAGEFGQHASDVNAYAASLFYAVDRFASFRQDWGEFYRAGGTVVAGRYVTSNAIHQMAKLPQSEWEPFLRWLYDLEYIRMGVPSPDLVVYLDMPPAMSQKLLSGRYAGDESKKDIHERDFAYLEICARAAAFAASFSGWQTVSCVEDGAVRTVDEIAAEILERVNPFLEMNQ